LVEGFFRNYLNNPAVLLAKDALLAAIYLRIFGEQFLMRRRLFYQTPFNLALLIFFIINLTQIFNPNNLAFTIGLIGLRSSFMYMPLMFLIPEIVNTRKNQTRFNWFILIVALIVSSFGTFQYFLGYQAYQALGPGFAQSLFVTTGELNEVVIFRPNSTFSWSGHYSVFLSFVTLFIIGLSFQKKSSLRWVAWLSLVPLAFAVLVAGQRTDYVLLPLLTILMLVVMRRISSAFLLILPLAIGAMLVLGTLADESVIDRLTTISTNKDEVIFTRLAAGWGNTITGIVLNPIGVGTGMATLGTQYASAQIPYFFEGYYGKISAELGWLGLGVFIWLCISIIRYLISLFKEVDTITDKWSVLVMLMYVLAIVYRNFVSNALDVAVANIFFWVAIGLIVAIHRLNKAERTVPPTNNNDPVLEESLKIKPILLKV
jgi:hypothetical protein